MGHSLTADILSQSSTDVKENGQTQRRQAGNYTSVQVKDCTNGGCGNRVIMVK
jgi:hypothetical protein